MPQAGDDPPSQPSTIETYVAPPVPPRHSWGSRFRRVLLGGKRELHDPRAFHKVSLIAFLAWVGLGADGLSSSAYGPEEAFKALGGHTYLAPLLALATAITVLLIAYAYSRIIEQFPFGGGGYVVAKRLLGNGAGLVSGSALVVDYILTIAISIAAGADALFSFLPVEWSTLQVLGFVPLKVSVEFLAIGLLITLNLRGVKESVTLLTPIFLLFLVTHAILIVGVIAAGVGQIPATAGAVTHGFSQNMDATTGLGAVGLLALFLRAYSLGGGTYTGIEAVSNGLAIMREPKIATGKRTMALMATSLALTASGLIAAYLLAQTSPQAGRTMNAVLVSDFAGTWVVGGLAVGAIFVLITLVSEALLLFVAAQAGFIDGPRVMANMATDSYLPHRMSQLSERLTMQNGVLIMGCASLLALVCTGGSVTTLVVLYSINVFVTFSLSQLAMCRFWVRERMARPRWKQQFSIHAAGLSLCATILGVTVFEKFHDGGWITLVVTGLFIVLCALIRRHYRKVQRNLRRLDEILEGLPPTGTRSTDALDPKDPTAVVLVGSYAGLGVHSLLTLQQLFPGHFRNFIFASVGVIDSATFTNVEAVDEVRANTRKSLEHYVELARDLGLKADARMAMGTEAVADGEMLCRDIAREFPRSIFFAGKLVFEEERWYQRLLHNETAYSIQRRLQFAGLNAMVLPVRVLGTTT